MRGGGGGGGGGGGNSYFFLLGAFLREGHLRSWKMKVILTRHCEGVYLGVVALRECEVFNVCQGCVSSAIVLFIVKRWLRCVK